MKTHTLETYQDESKQWRWRVKHRNGRIVANGGEAYKRRGAMFRALSGIARAIAAGTLALVLLAGCASGIQKVLKTTTTTTLGTNGQPVVVVEELQLNSRLRTLLDAKNTMDKLKVSTTKTTSSIGLENVEQVSSGSNMVQALQSIERILQTVK